MLCYLNGKFASQRVTGVQRVAWQLVRALDALLQAQPVSAARWVLLCPAGVRLPRLGRIEVRRVGPARLPLHLWEQVCLPWAARDGLLVNLAGAAPYFARREVALLHDAAVFDQPQAYTRAFVGWYRLLFRHLGRRAERLLTVSVFSQQRLAQCLGVAARDIALVPNGGDHLEAVIADRGVLARHDLQGKRFLLAVASANPTKNLAALLRAFAALPPDPSLRLVIVGGANTQVFAGATAVGDPPGVVRTGALGDAQLKALYAHAVALVFPSYYEGFGLPPLEAMSCGCPVAVADAAALPEVCAEAALYFDPRSVPGIAAALLRLLEEPDLRDRLRARGTARVAQFRWSAAAARLLAVLTAAATE